MTNKEIKAEAREMLKGKKAKVGMMTFLYVLFMSVVGGVIAGIIGPNEVAVGATENVQLSVVDTLVTYFAQSIVLLGYISAMMKVASGGNFSFKELFSKVKYTLKTLGLTLLILFYTVLWSCLFIIPGIIKGISYSMAYYILLEDPSKGINQCITESKEMMKGNKAKLFGMLLSFIGWILLSVVAFIAPFLLKNVLVALMGPIGNVLVLLIFIVVAIVSSLGLFVWMPYVEISKIKFYYDLTGGGNNYNDFNSYNMDEKDNITVKLGGFDTDFHV